MAYKIEEILDQENEKGWPHTLTTFMDRIRHFSVDIIFVFAISMLLFFNVVKPFFNISEEKPLGVIISTFAAVYFFYYTFLEFYLQLTIGKFFNKSRVVQLSWERPSFKQVFLRTVFRLIPISVFLNLTPYRRAIHDVLSSTWVVRKERKKVINLFGAKDRLKNH